MAAPTNFTYSRGFGQRVYGGKTPPNKSLDSSAVGSGSAVGALTHGVPLSGTASGSLSASGALSGGSAGVTVSLASLSLVSSSPQTAPFSVGHTFKQGDVPSGSGVSISGATAQFTPKNYWPDGSVKFGVIAGTATLAAGTNSVMVQRGTASSGIALTTTDLKAAMTQPATVDAGSFGSASWSGTDWDAPFEAWISGHLMSSWVYRKPIGSDPHLVAWLEVKLFSTGAVEVLPWVENGYLLVASPGQKSETYSFTMGGTTRFSALIDLLHHQRTPLLSGTALAHWLGADPNVIPVHDTDYMQASGLVPAYHAKSSATSAVIVGYDSNPGATTSFTPLQLSNFTNGNAMSGGGFSNHIGLLPEWDVAYLTYPAALTYKSVVFNGYSFGRYPIHYREDPDFATVADRYKPARLLNHPTLNIADPSAGWTTTPATSGSQPPGWALSHQPSCCFVAYLATGRRYFLDEVQFAAATNAMRDLKSTNRENGKGLFKSQFAGNERHVAWSLRSLAQAIAATPDSDTTFLNEFRTQYQNNMDYYHTRYVGVGGPSAPIFNNGGFVQPSSDLGNGGVGTFWINTWMQDFITASIGYGKDLGLGLDSIGTTRLNEFFEWKSTSVVKRFGFTGGTEFLFRDYGPYYLPIAPTDTPDWTTGTGPWYHNTGNGWGDIYSVCYSGSNPPDGSTVPYTAPGAKTEGTASIRVWYITNSGPIAALPALAYAVKHGIPGAEIGWARLTNAENWWSMQQDMDAKPLWSVAPRAYPKWWRGVAVNQWVEIPGVNMVTNAPPERVVWNIAQPDTAIQVPPGSGNWFDGGPVVAHTVQRTTGANIHGNRLDGYCGMTYDTRRSTAWTVLAGGHGDYWQNEMVRCDLRLDNPTWEIRHAGSDGDYIYSKEPYARWASIDIRRYADGLPAARHTYANSHVIGRHNRAILTAGSISSPGSGYQNIESWNIDAAKNDNAGFDTQDTYPTTLGTSSNTFTSLVSAGQCKDPRTEIIYTFANAGVHALTPSASGPTGSAGSGGSRAFYSLTGTNWNSAYGFVESAAAVDTRRSRILLTHGWAENSKTQPYVIDLGNLAHSGVIRPTYTGPAAATLAGGDASPGLIYVPRLDVFLLRTKDGGGAGVYSISAGTFSASVLSTTNGSVVPASTGSGSGGGDGSGIYNKWQFDHSLRGAVEARAQKMYFLRLY